MSDNHHYELKYFYKNKEVSVKFGGDVSLEDLEENLEDFLLAAGWSKTNTNKLFGNEDES